MCCSFYLIIFENNFKNETVPTIKLQKLFMILSTVIFHWKQFCQWSFIS